MATPARGWIARRWTVCGTPPRPACSTGCICLCRRPARARLRLPGADHRGARAVRRQRAVPRGPGARRGSAGDAAGADAGRDRRVRAGEDRRALPARQALPRPRRARSRSGRPPTATAGWCRPMAAPARIEIFEPEAEIVRVIFDAYVEKGRSVRQIAFDLRERGIPSPTGKPIWGTSTITRLLQQRGVHRHRLLQPPRVTGGQRPARRAQPQDPPAASARARSGSRSRSRDHRP